MFVIFTGEDEEWSDSEKTPSVSSGLEGGAGSPLSSPSGAGGGSHLVDEDLIALPPPPRLSGAVEGSESRLRLSTSSSNDDVVRKRLASSLAPSNTADDYEVIYHFFISNKLVSINIQPN